MSEAALARAVGVRQRVGPRVAGRRHDVVLLHARVGGEVQLDICAAAS